MYIVIITAKIRIILGFNKFFKLLYEMVADFVNDCGQFIIF